MELLIVRHAIAYERDARRWPEDGERPLSPRGVARARRAAAGLKRLTARPGRVLTSPLVRARQTAEILTQFAGWPTATTTPLLLPDASPAALLAFLARAREGSVAIVGHEPQLGQVLAACLPGTAASGAHELRKMGVALVAFRDAARPGHGELVWLATPRLLRAARRSP
jgi:phosphohistidine phosphatase